MNIRSQSKLLQCAIALLWLLGAGSLSQAQTNRVLGLDGAGAFVELPRGSLTNLSAATVEMWVNWLALEGQAKRAFNYGTPWRDVSIGAQPNGEIWFVFPQGSRESMHQINTRSLVVTNTWYHLAATLGPGGMKLYVNGWLIDSDPFEGSFDKASASALFRFGETITTNDRGAAFRGYIDEIRIWNSIRTMADIRANMHRRLTGSEPSLVSLWNFDDGSARDSGPNHLDGSFKGKSGAVRAEIPESIGREQIYLDARVVNFKGEPDEAVLEIRTGTNLLTAKLAGDGIFKLILPAPNGPMTLQAHHLYGSSAPANLTVAPGEQGRIDLQLPVFVASAENTNQFAAALNDALTVDPTTIERMDRVMMLKLSPLLIRAEPQILSLLESRDAGRRRFMAMALEKFPHATVPMVAALARARHDMDDTVRSFAQRALQRLPVPKEFEAFYTKREVAVAGLFAGLLVPFALIHFFLFILRPEKKSNLYYGLFAGAGAAMIYFGADGGSDTTNTQIAGLAFMTLGLVVLYSLFAPRFPWTFWCVIVFVVAAIAFLLAKRAEISALAATQIGSSIEVSNYPIGVVMAVVTGYLALFVVILDMLRVVLRSIWRGQEGAWLVGAGFLMLVVAGLVRFILYLGLFSGGISTDTFAKYIIYFPNVGAAGFVICGSVYLAKAFSKTFVEVQAAKIEIEKKNAELTLARDVALSANQAKSQFLANMSHELRTPLNAIIGYSELVAEIAADEGHKAYLSDLEKITSAARHQLILVNDILDLSKIEAGKMTMHIEDFDVRALINEIKTVIAPLVAKKRNRLEIDCPSHLGSMRADATKVRQILFNLLSNAAKFTEDGTITLRVRLDNDAKISFAVIDSGIGLTPDQTSRLFQAFTQAEAAIHQKYGGTGLGLVISRRFCELMGGELTVKSDFGKGSNFTARIPLRVAAPIAKS